MKQFIYFIKNCFKYKTLLSNKDIYIEDYTVHSLNELKVRLENFLISYPNDNQVNQILYRIQHCLDMIDRIKTISYTSMYFQFSTIYSPKYSILTQKQAYKLLETAEKRDKTYLMKQLNKIYSAGYMI